MEQNGNPNREPITRPDQLLSSLNDLYQELQTKEIIKQGVANNPRADENGACEALVIQAYYSVKEAVGNILLHNPEIKNGPLDSNNPADYLMNAKIWCLEQIRAQELKAEAKKPAETEQKTIWTKIKAWLWKLYEKTVKAIVAAVLEWWSKSK